MALEFAHGAIQWLAADALNHVYTVSGLAFQPKALRFYWQGLGSSSNADSETVHSRRGIGFATGTADRRCVGSQDQDAAGSAVCTTGHRTDCVAMTLTSTPAADGLLDLNSITSDGFTLIVDDAAPVDITVFWEAWGGSDITVATTGELAEPGVTGNQDYTVTGFVAGATDQVVMFAGAQDSATPAPTSSRQDSGLCVGFASGGTAAENIVIVGNSDDASATMDTDRYGLSGECLAMIVRGGGNPNARATLTQWNTNGFRLNWLAVSANSRNYIFLAIKGGQWSVGKTTLDIGAVSNTATVSGLPFSPAGLSLLTIAAGESTAGTSSTTDLLMLGSGASPSDRRAMGHRSEDATANAEIDLSIVYNGILVGPGASGVSVITVDLDEISDTGFRLIVDATTVSGTIWIGYLACGNARRRIVPILQAVRRASSY